MKNQNFTTTFSVDQTPEEAFDAINNVRGWWSQTIEGETDRLGAVFFYHYQDVHRCTFKITELVAGKKVVWHVLHNYFNFVEDQTEWNDTDIVFEIARKDDKREVRFTHVGLVPAYECYGVCSDAWGSYINVEECEYPSRADLLPARHLEFSFRFFCLVGTVNFF